MVGESSDGSKSDTNKSGVMVSLFDDSVDNYFRTMDAISQLCGAKEGKEASYASDKRFSSTITFLREWRAFCYTPRTVRFAYEVDSSQGKDVLNNGINLPQFSAASIPKLGSLSDETSHLKASKDSVLYVGGPVWALDWCPNVHHGSDPHIKCEYLAVSAHPPGSSYHEIGAALTGLGVIQIWCLLNVKMKEEELPPLEKPKETRGRPRKSTIIKESVCEDKNEQSPPLEKPRGRPRKNPAVLEISPSSKKARGRPRKTEESIGDLDRSNQIVQALANPVDKSTEKVSPPLKKGRGKPSKKIAIVKTVGDVDSNDQSVQAPAVQLDERVQKTSPPLSKIFKRSIKKKSAKRSIYNMGIECQTVRALAVEFPVNQSKLHVETEPVHITDEHALLTNHYTEIYIDRNTQEGCSDTELSGHMTPNTERQMKNNLRIEIFNDDNQRSYVAAEQATISCGQDAMPRPKRKVKSNAREQICNEDIDLLSNFMEEEPSDGTVQETKNRGKGRVTRPKIKKKDKASVGNQLLNSMEEEASAGLQATETCEKDQMSFCQNAASSDTNMPNFHFPKDIALPRVVLCLAHNGKVAWDVKWRPSSINDLEGKHCMGYLAVLLGNGSFEVWEVPFPGTVKALYSCSEKENMDPRFVKLAPVFRCSKLRCGDRQSIPITLEWSPSSSHDLIVAGCHDGTVALWKFSPSYSCQDSRPLLCFSADTHPIRALAWAPNQGSTEGANVIVTAGHGGLRFWDLRDPFHSLWDLNPGRRGIYSLDWLPDPRCIIMSFDDGTIRFMSMLKVANDVPVTGNPFSGTQQQGLHCYLCSSFPIWSVQASRLTGLVAYSSADGSVLRFQLTSKAVDKEPGRNKTPHFLCGSLTAKEDSSIEINTPFSNTPYPMKKSLNEWSDTPRSIRGFLADINQAKKESGPAPDDSNLALCYGDDPLISCPGDETPIAIQKSKSTPKPKVPRQKIPSSEIICSTREPENLEERGKNQRNETESKIEVFPSKLVAVHRVRWNMNKGSERWLCYGGAAGIVRCQEISTRSIAEGLLIKR